MKFQTTIYVLAIFLFSGTAPIVKAEEPKKVRMYKLLGTALKGSKLRPIEATSPIPFNKRFNQLSEPQMRIYRSYFEDLKKIDTPPYPKRGLKEIYVPLVKGHKRIGGNGELLVYAEINEEGGVDNVTVYTSPTKKLAELATTVMFNTKFKPALCDGKPCAMIYPFYYDVPQRFRELESLDKEDFG